MKSLFALPPGWSPGKLWVYAAIGAALTVAVVPWSATTGRIPDQQSLASASGTLTSIAKHKYGIKFELSGHERVFDYPSKHRGYDIVLSALETAGKDEVVVLYERSPRSPWFSDEKYYDVWQVQVGNRLTRSLQDAQAGWKSDEAIRPWLAGVFAICSLYLAVMGYRAHAARAESR
ncbi:hypothetical protein [Ideonella paludis]|uniref:DUF3592 domain-containing protein n=1 Tax=Ideonella paludis TaxID=1233411 RepID=A0ABS5DYU4_9BURK|nr:hypothetical protein [Ideonella paludis]MBQ0936317.1 hypothetical protein [Ideonella paludis]